MNKENIILWLKEQMAREGEMSLDQIKPTDSIARFGIDSVVLVTIAVDLEAYVGKEIDPTIFYEFDTIEELSTYIVEEILD
jgi:acyl carrier protein